MELLPEIESDLSVFHRIEEMESMSGPRFARLVPLLPVYGGAVAFALAQSAAAAPAEQSPLVPVPQGPAGSDVIIGTKAAIMLSPHSDLFEFSEAPGV